MKKSVWSLLALIILMLALLAPACLAEAVTFDQQKLDTNYALALAYIGREDYDKAMGFLDTCLTLCDENSATAVYADVHLKKACIYTIRQDYDKAMTELDETLRVQPDLSEAYLVKTQVHSDRGEYEEAADALQKYIDLTGDKSLYEVKAEIYSAVGNVDKALESYKVYAESGSESPVEASYKTAIYNMEKGKFEDAIRDFATCLKDKTYGPSSQYNTGVCYMRMEDYESALKALNEVKDQEFDGLNYNIGVCSMLLEKTEDAIAAFGASIEKESFVSDALYNRAICYVSVKEFAKAIVDFTAYLDSMKAQKVEQLNAQAAQEAEASGKKAKTVKPEEVEDVVDVATYYRGVCHLSVNNFDAAIADFTACIDQNLSVDDSRFNRGITYLQAAKNEEAKADLTECIKNGYNTDAATFYRSFALVALGDTDGAIADLTTCIDHGYNLGQAYYQRAQVYMVTGNNDGYVADLEESLKY